MKPLLNLLAAGLLLSSTTAYAQTSFYDHITQLWLAGQKQAVLAIAQQRLQQDPDDIAGLLIKLQYQIRVIDAVGVAETAPRVVAIGETITTENFRREFPTLKHICTRLQATSAELIANPQELERERAKFQPPTMPLGPALKALQDDGYFNR